MNYIRHLNAFFEVAKYDRNLTAAHVSLYMAIFQCWNYNRFQNPFQIQRENMMQLSKIGSKNTYHKCIRDLHLAHYILYHTQVSKFQHIKISMLRFDKQHEQDNSKQLDVFTSSQTSNGQLERASSLAPSEEDLEGANSLSECASSLPSLGGDLEGVTCIKNDTTRVPHLTATCPTNNTDSVSNPGRYYIKQNNKQINSVCKTPTKIFNKNKKILNAINGFARVPHSVLTKEAEVPLSFGEGLGVRSTDANFKEGRGLPAGQVRVGPPSKPEVEFFFTQNSYPTSEANKFFYYNNGKGWMLTDKIPIKDWQSLAHKWMLNEKGKNKSIEKPIYHTEPNKDYSEPL